MKLLYCVTCEDVFKLDIELRVCRCGIVKGRYINNEKAESNGKGISIAIGNGSLRNAIEGMKQLYLSSKGEGSRSEYIEAGNGKISHAWVRPNTGEGNPHMIINKKL